jgi:hypothetical protein
MENPRNGYGSTSMMTTDMSRSAGIQSGPTNTPGTEDRYTTSEAAFSNIGAAALSQSWKSTLIMALMRPLRMEAQEDPQTQERRH